MLESVGRWLEKGEVLDILARHPSTARFIARKLIVRFVSDTARDSCGGFFFSATSAESIHSGAHRGQHGRGLGYRTARVAGRAKRRERDEDFGRRSGRGSTRRASAAPCRPSRARAARPAGVQPPRAVLTTADERRPRRRWSAAESRPRWIDATALVVEHGNELTPRAERVEVLAKRGHTNVVGMLALGDRHRRRRRVERGQPAGRTGQPSLS